MATGTILVRCRSTDTLKLQMENHLESCHFRDLRSATEEFYDKFKCKLVYPEAFRMFSKYLVMFVCKYDCHDVTLVSRILYVYARMHGYYNPPFLEEYFLLTFHRRRRFKRMWSIVLECLNPVRTWHNYFRVTYSDVLGGDYEFLHSMVKYGFTISPIVHENETKCLVFNFWQWICYARARLDAVIDDVPSPIQRIQQYIRLCRSSDSRKCLVLWTMHLILSHHPSARLRVENFGRDIPKGQLVNRLKALNLLSRCIPEPFVTLSDVRFFCDAFFGIPIPRAFEEVRDTFATLFPESAECYAPRSLLDLTRCRVRDCIRKDYSLPDQLSNLPIPAFVRDFILFRDRKRTP